MMTLLCEEDKPPMSKAPYEARISHLVIESSSIDHDDSLALFSSSPPQAIPRDCSSPVSKASPGQSAGTTTPAASNTNTSITSAISKSPEAAAAAGGGDDSVTRAGSRHRRLANSMRKLVRKTQRERDRKSTR